MRVDPLERIDDQDVAHAQCRDQRRLAAVGRAEEQDILATPQRRFELRPQAAAPEQCRAAGAHGRGHDRRHGSRARHAVARTPGAVSRGARTDVGSPVRSNCASGVITSFASDNPRSPSIVCSTE